MKHQFTVRQSVRYKPGAGTYGYEDLIQQDGRIPAAIRGFGPPRKGNRADRGPLVKIEFFRGKTALRRAVDASSLIPADRELGAGEAAAAIGSFVTSKSKEFSR